LDFGLLPDLEIKRIPEPILVPFSNSISTVAGVWSNRGLQISQSDGSFSSISHQFCKLNVPILSTVNLPYFKYFYTKMFSI